MILRKINLPPKNEKHFVAVITADDKFLQDEIEEVWEKMVATGKTRATYEFGPFFVEVRPVEQINYAAG